MSLAAVRRTSAAACAGSVGTGRGWAASRPGSSAPRGSGMTLSCFAVASAVTPPPSWVRKRSLSVARLSHSVPTEAESKTISAAANGIAITQTATVTVTSQPPNSAPVVDAGADDAALPGVRYVLTWRFSDPDNGPWSYTIDWGDGTTSSGNKTFSADTCFNEHTYDALLPQSFTVRVTVVDSQGAEGSDTKVVTVM